MTREGERGSGHFTPISLEPDYAVSDIAGFTLMNNEVGAAIAQVMQAVPKVTVTFMPSMIRVNAVSRMDVVYDHIAEALGEEPGSFDAAQFEEAISTHSGRMIHEENRTVFFANPEEAAAYLGFDLFPQGMPEPAAADTAEPEGVDVAGPEGVEPAEPEAVGVTDPWDTGDATAVPGPEETPRGSRSAAVPGGAHQNFNPPVYPPQAAFGVSAEGGGNAAPPYSPDPPGGGPPGGGDSSAGRRYLKGQCAETVPVGRPFSLLVSIVMADSADSRLEPFDVPPEGRGVLLVAQAPKLRLLGEERQTVHVPAAGDSRPVMFELRADEPGPRQVSVTAWIAGTWLGELQVEVAAEVDSPLGPHRDVLAEVSTEPVDGAVSLVVRYDPVARAYRFEFRDEDNPDEVTSNLSYDPAPIVERLVADLNDLAKGRTGYSAAQTRDYLLNAGAQLWTELVPGRLREQFWERQQRIRQLTILADRDVVPWELLYPMDPGHDAGFLVEQFPVTRCHLPLASGPEARPVAGPVRASRALPARSPGRGRGHAAAAGPGPCAKPGDLRPHPAPGTDRQRELRPAPLRLPQHLQPGRGLLDHAGQREFHPNAADDGCHQQGAGPLRADRVHERLPQRRPQRDVQPARRLGQQVPRGRGRRVHRVAVGGVRRGRPRVRRGILRPAPRRAHARGSREPGPAGRGRPGRRPQLARLHRVRQLACHVRPATGQRGTP